MSEHALNTRDDSPDRAGRSAAARALLANDEIEALLGPGSSAVNATTGNSNQFVRQTEEAISELAEASGRSTLPTDVRSFCLKEFITATHGIDLAGLAANGEAQLEVRIELGRTYMNWEETRRLRHGSVVSLDSAADEPVAIYANNRLIARGELLVMNGTFCVRVLELVAVTMAKAG